MIYPQATLQLGRGERPDTPTAFLAAFYSHPFNRLVAVTDVECRNDAFTFSPNESDLKWETDRGRELRIQRAKAICADCPIFDACRTYAVERNEPFGIWGGLTERGRRRARAGRGRARKSPEAERTHCPTGHEYTEANTRIKRHPDGTFKQRDCRACSNIRNADYRRRVRSGEVARDRARADRDAAAYFAMPQSFNSVGETASDH